MWLWYAQQCRSRQLKPGIETVNGNTSTKAILRNYLTGLVKSKIYNSSRNLLASYIANQLAIIYREETVIVVASFTDVL